MKRKLVFLPSIYVGILEFILHKIFHNFLYYKNCTQYKIDEKSSQANERVVKDVSLFTMKSDTMCHKIWLVGNSSINVPSILWNANFSEDFFFIAYLFYDIATLGNVPASRVLLFALYTSLCNPHPVWAPAARAFINHRFCGPRWNSTSIDWFEILSGHIITFTEHEYAMC